MDNHKELSNVIKRNFKKADDGRSARKVRGKKASTIRTRWSILSSDEMALPGAVLLQWLLTEANRRNLLLSDMARELNVTYGYINQLKNGIRGIDHISDQFAADCAKFLGKPRLQILLASGRLAIEDYFDDQSTLQKDLDSSLDVIAKDKEFGALLLPDLYKSRNETKYLIIRLFEMARSMKLLHNEFDPADLLKQDK